MFGLKDLKAFGNAVINGGKIICSDESGVTTGDFETISECVRIKFKGKTDSKIAFGIYVTNSDNDRWRVYGETFSKEFEINHTFDAVNLAVYNDAKKFSVEIYGKGDESEFEISEFSVTEESNNGENTAGICEINNLTIMENGEKGVYVTLLSGDRKVVPAVPKKVLFVGNSLLFGMYNCYGMCATGPDKDYFHYVSNEILKHNPDCEFVKIHGVWFECCEKREDFETALNEPNRVTNRPTIEHFTEDLDLIVIQLGDNVNNEDRTSTFKLTLEPFIKFMKEKCPNARIIWMFGWYNRLNVMNKLGEMCEKWGIENIDLSLLHTKETESYKGQLSLDAEGNMVEVSDLWISHPGDEGMKAIADKLTEVLGL